MLDTPNRSYLERTFGATFSTNAAGRTMTYRDHEEVEQTANRALLEGCGFRKLIVDVAMSKAFTNR